MVSSFSRFRHLMKRDPPEQVTACVYHDCLKDRNEEKFPIFCKDLFFSVFPSPINVKDRRADDDKETNPEQFMKILRHLGSGRLGKSYLAKREDLTPYSSTTVTKHDNKLVVVMTIMDAKRVDYIDAVRAVEPFTLKGGEPSPFLGKILLSFRSSLPYLVESYYFISEYARDSMSLCHRLQQEGRLSDKDSKFYIAELIEVVAYLHNRGKMIRRLCLCSLLIDPTGHLKLVPYTLCEQNLDCGQSCNMLVKNCGDQFYAAPEVVFGVDVQFTADWWSVGVIMYQLLTGQLPFTGRTLGDLGKAITESPLCPSDHITCEAAAFLKHILHKDPRRRLGFSGLDSLETTGIAQVKEHPYFQGTQWDDVGSLLLIPPYIPRAVPSDVLEVFRGRIETASCKDSPKTTAQGATGAASAQRKT